MAATYQESRELCQMYLFLVKTYSKSTVEMTIDLLQLKHLRNDLIALINEHLTEKEYLTRLKQIIENPR